MKKIFPPEIVDSSVESHFHKFSKFSNVIYIFTILLVIGIGISLFFIKTDISVQSAGIIRSLSDPVDITSPTVAEVIKTDIAENRLVKKGDTLVWLNSEKLKERIEYLNSIIIQNNDFQNDLKVLLDGKYSPTLETELFKSILAKYQQKLEDLNLEINLSEKSFNRTKLLFEQEVLPANELEKQQFQLEKAIENRKNFIKQNRSEWQQLITEYELSIKKYKNEISELYKDLKNYIILSPQTGYITNFNGIQSGSFVTVGQRIAIISPDDKLISEHYVSPNDIGYLRNKMPVRFQIHAYNYREWGFASGEVMDISNEVYLLNDKPFFKVRCSLEEQYLALENGIKGNLKKGLTTTARFQITKRSITQLLFDKADDWLNPKLNK
ncbi:HlyD family secretion protein [Tangfeifania diversioriginum]|uniref:HlyD family secretion protein n=1 Tax=Tangfeifania diversioriginum TaxID=1168035 RepID=A0A1M6P753_9BACT|nr:HlyD family efflux transporter periplasmic adaptor subunit [Tangfeifania diversioriginum]SHK03710.1 HlyD family secretion protein [Tangfeifania diversioriginum]